MLSLFQKKIRTDYFRLSASVSHSQKPGTAHRIRHLHFTDCTVLRFLKSKLLYKRIPQSNRNNSETVSAKKEMNLSLVLYSTIRLSSALYSKKSKSAHFLWRTRSAQVMPTMVPVNSPYLQYSSENLVVSKMRPIFS